MVEILSLLVDLEGWLLAAYYATLFVLGVYGVHRIVLLRLLQASRGSATLPPSPPPADPAPSRRLPWLTVQLPIFNELYVGARLVDAACALDYPRERLEIQVLDDSTDATTDVVAARVAYHRARGIDIKHRRREERSGFKAGALDSGLRVAKGELIAVFDADFVPQPDFLLKTVGYFEDSRVGLVQARWDHLNRHYSRLTRAQATLLDGHFLIEQAARHAAGCFFNFNGTAGVFRRRAIEEAGGWQHDTLTEDLDLSYRAQLRGWKFVFAEEVAVPAELPVEVQAFKSQQHRWSKGSAQTCRKLLSRLLKAPLPFATRAEAVIHLTSNFCYPLMVLLSVLVFPAMIVRRGTELWTLLAWDLPLLLAASLSVLAFYVASQRRAGYSVGVALLESLSALGLGIGLCLNNAGAVLAGLVRRGGTFHRTPKHRVEGLQRLGGDLYRSRLQQSSWLELAFALYFLACIAASVKLKMWAAIPFLLLFLYGYSLISLHALSSLLKRPDLGDPSPAPTALESPPW